MLAHEANVPFHPKRDQRRNVEINIGKACNNRCVFCIDGLPKMEDRSYMNFDLMKDELRRWREDGHTSVGFLGGEPTTYPKIVQSVAYARELGFTRIAIATNATKLRLEHFTDKILDAGLTRITVSMHGHTPELEDKLTRVPGNFEKKCRAIRYLQKKQREGYLPDGLSVNIVLNGWNYKHLLDMMSFFYETMGLPDLRVNFIRPEGYAVGSRELVPRYDKVRGYVAKAIVANERHFRKTLTFGGFPLCVLPKALLKNEALLQSYIGELRDLTTSCSIRSETLSLASLGPYPMAFAHPVLKKKLALRRQYTSHTTYLDPLHPLIWEKEPGEGRIRFNWQLRRREALKGRPKGCNSCQYSNICEGVWVGYLDIWGEDIFEEPSLGFQPPYIEHPK